MLSLARTAMLISGAFALLGLQTTSLYAEHDNFRFKWPYEPGVSHPTTSFPFEPRPGGGMHADAPCRG